MKRIAFLATVAMVCMQTEMNAQTVTRRDMRNDFLIGAKAGINGANVWDEKGGNFTADPRVGFVGGGFVSIPMGKYLGLQPEVLYSQKGFKASGTMLGAAYTLSNVTTWLDVPVLVQVKPTSYLTVVGGPVYSYLLRQRETYTWVNSAVEREQEFDNDNIRRNRMGLMIGADFVAAPFVIGGRAGWDLQDNLGDGTSSQPRYKNQWLQLTVGFQL